MAPPSLPVTTMRLSDVAWRYLGEGNRHVVLELIGSGHVLRLHKNNEDRGRSEERIRAATEFVNCIMLPLLVDMSPIEPEEVVALAQEDIAQLNQVLANVRPPSRRHKLIQSELGTRALNYTLVPNSTATGTSYCVEIKPKLGFVPNELRKYGKCSYCLKQYLKFSKHQITHIGDYCPLNLFSGDKSRVMKALLSLTNTPQNNFKIFKNSEIIYSEFSEPASFGNSLSSIMLDLPFNDVFAFVEFLANILILDTESEETLAMEIVDKDKVNPTSINRDSLKPNSVLGRILHVQKLWIGCNVESSDLGDYDYVEPLLDLLRKGELNLSKPEHRTEFVARCDDICRCMMASVARDCSIMISFSQTVNATDSARMATVDGRRFMYNVSVTDLEPKPISSIKKRKTVYSDAIKAFKNVVNTNEDNNSCRIQPHAETRAKQLAAWQNLIVDYLKRTKQSTIDVREGENLELFNNTSINRKLSQESILLILEDMAKNGRAAPTDKSKTVWEVYWHSLEEWGNMVYGWACANGINNTVCTLYELREGENTVDEEFHGLDDNILVKALKALELKGKCELIELDDSQGVKFF